MKFFLNFKKIKKVQFTLDYHIWSKVGRQNKIHSNSINLNLNKKLF